MKTIKTYSFDCLDLSKPLKTLHTETIRDLDITYFKRGKLYQFTITDKDTGELLDNDMRGFTAQSVYIQSLRSANKLIGELK